MQVDRPGFAEDTLLHVELGELLDRTRFLRRQLGDLLVDRDGFGDKAVGEIDLREPLEILQGLEGVTLPHKQVADGHQRDLILGLVLQNLNVFLNGLSDLALMEVAFARSRRSWFCCRPSAMLYVPSVPAPRPEFPRSGQRLIIRT